MIDTASTPPQAVLPATQGWPLHGTAASRRLEAAGLAATAPQALMQRAGLALARLAQALAAPDAAMWVAAGPGNNGGDGLVAALHLHQWGRAVQVCWLGDAARLPADAADALARAQAGGVAIATTVPDAVPAGFALDALLGLGTRRAPEGAVAQAIARLNAGQATVLAVDLPTGLCADTGRVLGEQAVRASHTLSLLTLKPGLFTHQGRDHSGRVWLHALGQPLAAEPASAWLVGPPRLAARQHAQHKGSFGDVVVLGGAPGMSGAALLAARAALAAGAGRVLVARLDGHALSVDMLQPELMPREPATALDADALARSTVVCGCGGGTAVQPWLARVLAHSARLVLDADGLNAVAHDAAWATALRERTDRGLATVLTPHPLEAARLLGCSAADVQADRLGQAQALADRMACTVVLKGSGTVVATPGRTALINPTGNARLGTAGSGDVLAGWLAGRWSASGPAGSADAHGQAGDAVWLHGAAAECGDLRLPLRASDLVALLGRTLPPA